MARYRYSHRVAVYRGSAIFYKSSAAADHLIDCGLAIIRKKAAKSVVEIELTRAANGLHAGPGASRAVTTLAGLVWDSARAGRVQQVLRAPLPVAGARETAVSSMARKKLNFNTMTGEQIRDYFIEAGKRGGLKGGHLGAAHMTPEQLSERGRKAVAARKWHPQLTDEEKARRAAEAAAKSKPIRPKANRRQAQTFPRKWV